MRAQFIDSEERQLRAMAAMDGLSDLLHGSPEGTDIAVDRIAALIELVFDAARDALPAAALLGGGANDQDD